MPPVRAAKQPTRPQPAPPPSLAPAHAPVAFSEQTRALANEGRLADALSCCERWIASEKTNAAAHYLRAVILLEQGESGEARRSLQRVLFLDPGSVLAHFTLGDLARRHGRRQEADKHFANSLQLLARLPPHDLLPESDGLTAGRLAETITALLSAGGAQ